MTENNELNLVISDEESANGLTGRSFQNTLSLQGSPSAQFIRTNGGGIQIGSFPQNAMSSSGLKDTIPSYDREFASNNGPQGYYYGDGVTGPKPTLESMASSYTGFNFDSNQQPQPGRTRTKDSYEPNTVESVPYGRDGYGENMSAPTFPNDDEIKRYANRGRLSYNGQGQLGKTAGAYGNDELFNDQDDQRDMYEFEERKTQSLKDSQLAGRVRYSKMSEEEAAIAFENRKKELFSTYLKKDTRKSPSAARSRTPNERSNQRGFMSPDDVEPFGKGSPAGFVIANEQSQNHKQAKRGNRTPVGKRRPSIDKKEAPAQAAKANLAKQRKDSPMAKNKPVLQKLPQNQNQNQSRHKVAQRPSQPKAGSSQTVNVGLRPSVKGKNNENQGASYNHYSEENDYERNRKLTPADNIGRPDYDSNHTGSNMYTSSKGTFRTQEILNDIHNLEEEILRLESESSRGYNSNDNYIKSEPQDEQQYQRTAKFASSGSYGQKYQEKGVKRTNSREKNKSETFQRQNSFERKTHSNERKSYDKNGRPSNISQASIKDQISQSYNALNEKEFEHRHDYLYERALVQKNGREFLRERSREMKENQELAQCTFAPQIKRRPEMKLEDIVIRTRKWQLEREEQYIRNEKDKIHKELRDCTFYPNNMLDRGRRLEFNSGEFYKKNIEWVKRKEAEDQRKQNENHNLIMQTGKRRSHSSVSMSRLHESGILPDPDTKGTERSRLGRSASNKSLGSIERPERSNSNRRRDNSGKRHHNSFCKACTSNGPQDRKSCKSEKGDENRKSVNPSVLGNKDTNIQPAIVESYAIINGLQQLVHSKEKENQQRVVQQKEDAIKKLKTISANQTKMSKWEQRNQENKIRSQLSPSRSQPNLIGKIAITSSNFDTNSLQDSAQTLTVRNNRYYLEEKPQEKPQSGASRGRTNSRDSRNRAMTPTKTEPNKSMRENSYSKQAQLAKTRKESPFRSKQPSKNFENSFSKNSYSDFMASPFQSLMTSPQAFGHFTSVNSQKSELNYVAKGLTSPNTQTLEKKYLSLLDQVSRVTKQLDQINVENNNLQNDISTMQRRQLNKSSSFHS